MTDEDLALLQAEIDGGDTPMRRALLQPLVEKIRVVSPTRSTRLPPCQGRPRNFYRRPA